MSRSTTHHLILFVVACGTLAAQALGQDSQPISSPESLWQGFDPEAEPLEIETVRSWSEDDQVYESLKFTGERVGGDRVRVFAIRGAPAAGVGRPGILHIHGGGQTVSKEWVRFWARRGYVCVSFDFCGRWGDRTEFTDWGPLTHGNMAQASGGFQLKPTPRASSWYHWALVSRRALTLLARDPRTDPRRLGVFGISVGGSLTWMVAGSDHRVTAAAPIYGCGYNYDRRNMRWGLSEPNEDLRIFQRVLSPEAHAPIIACPVLFLSATNDFHGLMDRSFETLGSVPAPVRQVFTPRYNHHLEPRQGRDLGLWMDWHLKGGTPWPAPPSIRLDLDQNGIARATVAPASPAEVEDVEVFYALGDKRPQARFWRRTVASRSQNHWDASLPVMDSWESLHAFANVTYRSGVCLSTMLVEVIPAQHGKARSTLSATNILEHGLGGLDHWFFSQAYTDPNVDWTYLQTGTDPAVGPYITLGQDRLDDPIDVRLATHLIGDPQFLGKDGMSLSFSCRGDFTEEGLAVTVTADDWGPQSRAYTAKIPRADLVPGWRDIILPLSRFVDPQGKPPDRWAILDKLEFRGKASRRDPPRFARLCWVPATVPKTDSRGRASLKSTMQRSSFQR